MKKETMNQKNAPQSVADETNKKSFLKNRGSRHGIIVTASCAVVLILFVIVNILLNQLPSSAVELDLSQRNIYSVSDASKEFINSLDQDVEIIILSDGTGNDYPRISKFIYNYAKFSDRITVTEIDPVLTPSVLDTYDCDTNYVVIRNPETDVFTTIPFTGTSGSMIDYALDQTSYELYEYAFDGDGLITSAINHVIHNTIVPAYIMEGHNEGAIGETILNEVKKSGLNVASDPVNILVDGGIPEDCQMLIINCPTVDLSEDELNTLREYLQTGGKVTVIIEQTNLSNFNTLFTEYGYEMQEGWLGDTANCYNDPRYGAYYFNPEISTSSEITKGIDAKAEVLRPRGMLGIEPARSTIEVSHFLYTSNSGFLEVDNAAQASGSYVIGGRASEIVTDKNGESATSSLTIITSPFLISESIIIQNPTLSNLDIFINALTYDFKTVDDILIPAKFLQSGVDIESSFWNVLFIGIIPAGILVCGFFFWNKRRKR